MSVYVLFCYPRSYRACSCEVKYLLQLVVLLSCSSLCFVDLFVNHDNDDHDAAGAVNSSNRFRYCFVWIDFIEV